jgi:hypothetical protein
MAGRKKQRKSAKLPVAKNVFGKRNKNKLLSQGGYL